jgi:hypothetical protein
VTIADEQLELGKVHRTDAFLLRRQPVLAAIHLTPLLAALEHDHILGAKSDGGAGAVCCSVSTAEDRHSLADLDGSLLIRG